MTLSQYNELVEHCNDYSTVIEVLRGKYRDISPYELMLHMEFMKVKKDLEYSVVSHRDIKIAVDKVLKGFDETLMIGWDQGFLKVARVAIYDTLIWHGNLFNDVQDIFDRVDSFQSLWESADVENDLLYSGLLSFLESLYKNGRGLTNTTVVSGLPNGHSDFWFLCDYLQNKEVEEWY